MVKSKTCQDCQDPCLKDKKERHNKMTLAHNKGVWEYEIG